MASAVRSVSCVLSAPAETATTSSALPASFIRTASSTAISQKGFIAILTFAVSTPGLVGFHPHLHVGIDRAFDRNQNLHGHSRWADGRDHRRVCADLPPRAPHTMTGLKGCQRQHPARVPCWTLPPPARRNGVVPPVPAGQARLGEGGIVVDRRRIGTQCIPVLGRTRLLAMGRSLRGGRGRFALADRPPRLRRAVPRGDERDGGARRPDRAHQVRHERRLGRAARPPAARQAVRHHRRAERGAAAAGLRHRRDPRAGLGGDRHGYQGPRPAHR